jgi:hypothetical protein
MMKEKFCCLPVLLATALMVSAQTPSVEQMKSDLIGQTMGGREKCWKIQSREHIKALSIKISTEDGQKWFCTIALQLQATKACGKYAAEARVEYAKAETGWKIKQMGLLSLERID